MVRTEQIVEQFEAHPWNTAKRINEFIETKAKEDKGLTINRMHNFSSGAPNGGDYIMVVFDILDN